MARGLVPGAIFHIRGPNILAVKGYVLKAPVENFKKMSNVEGEKSAA